MTKILNIFQLNYNNCIHNIALFIYLDYYKITGTEN